MRACLHSCARVVCARACACGCACVCVCACVRACVCGLLSRGKSNIIGQWEETWNTADMYMTAVQ